MKALIVGLVLAVAGCTTNNLVMVAPQPAQTTQITCWVPEDGAKHYLVPHETARANAVASVIAREKHIGGCAAVAFQLTRDGKATNISVLREFPPDYGYGEAVSKSIRDSSFAPPTSTNDWYYRAITINFVNVRRAGPVRIAPPPQPAAASGQRT